jgi:hypothetical protein
MGTLEGVKFSTAGSEMRVPYISSFPVPDIYVESRAVPGGGSIVISSDTTGIRLQ